MREFRFLEEKRKLGGLSPAEEQRWFELRTQLGVPEPEIAAEQPPEAPQVPEWQAAPDPYAQPQGYYAADGNWYPYPPGYAPPPYPQYPPGYYAEDGNWYPYPPAYPPPYGYPYAPAGYYRPPGYPYPYDPAQAYDPAAYPPPTSIPEAQGPQEVDSSEVMEVDSSDVLPAEPESVVAPAAEPSPPTVEPEEEQFPEAVREEPFSPPSQLAPGEGSLPEAELPSIVVSADLMGEVEAPADARPVSEPAATPAEVIPEPVAPQLAVAPLPLVQVAAEPVIDIAPQPPLEVAPEPVFDIAPQPPLEVAPEPVIDIAPQPPLEVAPEPVIDIAPQPPLEVAPEPVIDIAPQPPLEVAPEPVIDIAPQPPLEVAPESSEVPVIDLLESESESSQPPPPEPILDGSPEDSIALAPASDFVTFQPSSVEPEASSLPPPAESPFEFGPIADFTSPEPPSAPAAESEAAAVPLASAADFLDVAELRSGEDPGPSPLPSRDDLFGAGGLDLVPEAGGSSFVEGEHRVIIHTVEGQVKRGVVRDLDLREEIIPLEGQGSALERIPANRVKAIFFMLQPGSPQPDSSGKRIRVTFNDGRQVAGFSNDFQGSSAGFFVVPADSRTNTARIYIFRSSVQAVAES